MRATATAHPNIALVKYWGKRDEKRVLPHQSSVSVTLAPLSVTTSVQFADKRGPDVITLNGREAQGTERDRVVAALQLIRLSAKKGRKGTPGAATVISTGDFPASAGLASSAAAFAALAVAGRVAAGLPRDLKAESVLARQGSGSAARSVHGGFVRWNRGKRGDGGDSSGEQLFGPDHWPDLRLLVAMVSREEKDVKSRDGMALTVKTSPYYPAWVKQAEADAKAIVSMLKKRDLEAVGALAERNAWSMHASALAATPPLCYLKPETVELINAVRRARREGIGVWFTLDAGPNPVLLTTAKDEARAEAIARACGAAEVVHCHPGGDARVG